MEWGGECESSHSFLARREKGAIIRRVMLVVAVEWTKRDDFVIIGVKGEGRGGLETMVIAVERPHSIAAACSPRPLPAWP